MTQYLLRRAGQSVAVVIGVMILTFLLLHLEPGSVARSVLGLKATPARVAIFDSLYGLNKPLYVQFGIYVKQVFQGNLGVSYQLQQPVASLIAQRLPRDAILLGLSTLLALVIGVPTGIYQAARHNRLADDLLAGSWFTLYSAPDFMEALLLIALLCVQFHVLPAAFPGSVNSVRGLARAGPSGRGAVGQQRGRLQPVRAVHRAAGPGGGLYPGGPGQGPAGAARADPARAAQLAAPGDHHPRALAS
jgi:peptide/nickel transport system permease protein